MKEDDGYYDKWLDFVVKKTNEKGFKLSRNDVNIFEKEKKADNLKNGAREGLKLSSSFRLNDL